MVKKVQSMNSRTNVNANSNVVNVHVPRQQRSRAKKEKRPNWLLKAIVVAAIGLIASVILFFVQQSTSANGKPAFIQNGTPPDNTK